MVTEDKRSFFWDGGPVVIISDELVPLWEGTEPPTNSRVVEALFRLDADGPATDYDRACDVQLVELLPVGESRALIINPEAEPYVTWVPAEDGGAFCAFHCSEPDVDAARIVHEIRNPTALSESIEASSGKLWLSSAAMANEEIRGDAVSAIVTPGTYSVEWELVSRENWEAIIVRLRRRG